MNTLLDQTWVRSWGKETSEEHVLSVALWVVDQTEHVQRLSKMFPPHAMVRRKGGWQNLSEAAWEKVPVPTTLGVIHSYHPVENQVLVGQAPGNSELAWVSLDELELVSCWAGLSADYLRAVLAMSGRQRASSAVNETQKRQPARLRQQTLRTGGVVRGEHTRVRVAP